MFNTKFNIGFGPPRADTCAKCDEFNVKIRAEEDEISKQELKKEKQEHLRQSDIFYGRKRVARTTAKKSPKTTAIAFDYWKNLPCPNVSTNDVYYRRQLSIFTFTIHALESKKVYLYTNDETTGRKGAHDVFSLLQHFFFTKVPENVKEVFMFCDGCPGQNKNYTMFRFLHSLVHV